MEGWRGVGEGRAGEGLREGEVASGEGGGTGGDGEREHISVNNNCNVTAVRLRRLPNPDFVHVLWGFSKVRVSRAIHA